MEAIEVSGVVGTDPLSVYKAWLDNGLHEEMTGGGAATGGGSVGAEYTAWDGHISGKVLALEPGKKLVLSYRTADFPAGTPDSQVEIVLAPEGAGTKVVFRHSQIPAGQSKAIENNWKEFYLAPMTAYFGDN